LHRLPSAHERCPVERGSGRQLRDTGLAQSTEQMLGIAGAQSGEANKGVSLVQARMLHLQTFCSGPIEVFGSRGTPSAVNPGHSCPPCCRAAGDARLFTLGSTVLIGQYEHALKHIREKQHCTGKLTFAASVMRTPALPRCGRNGNRDLVDEFNCDARCPHYRWRTRWIKCGPGSGEMPKAGLAVR
jgi:hypothetical protein